MAAQGNHLEPVFDPATIPDRVAELVRTVNALISEVCNCTEGELPDVPHWVDSLELARDALARCVAGRDAVEAEGAAALERLRDMPGVRKALLVFAATVASPAGGEGFDSVGLLPRNATHPPELSRAQMLRVQRVTRTARERRRGSAG